VTFDATASVWFILFIGCNTDVEKCLALNIKQPRVGTKFGRRLLWPAPGSDDEAAGRLQKDRCETNAGCYHQHDRYSFACGTKDDDMVLRTQRGYCQGVPMKTPEIDTLDRPDVQQPDVAPDVSPPDLCRQRAEECLNLSYQITDPKGQVAVLKLANCWMRLGEDYHSRKAAHDKASA
jgi:hypothetical protein